MDKLPKIINTVIIISAICLFVCSAWLTILYSRPTQTEANVENDITIDKEDTTEPENEIMNDESTQEEARSSRWIELCISWILIIIMLLFAFMV